MFRPLKYQYIFKTCDFRLGSFLSCCYWMRLEAHKQTRDALWVRAANISLEPHWCWWFLPLGSTGCHRVVFPNKSSCGLNRGFPAGSGVKESICQCRRHRRYRLDPWVRMILWSSKWQPIPVFLQEKFHEQRGLAIYSHGVPKTWKRLSDWAHMCVHAHAHTQTHTHNFHIY